MDAEDGVSGEGLDGEGVDGLGVVIGGGVGYLLDIL